MNGLPKLHNMKHLPKGTHLLSLTDVGLNSVEGIEWLLDMDDPDYEGREILKKVAYSIMEFYNEKYDVMKERIPADALAKLYVYVQESGLDFFNENIYHFTGEVPPKGAKTLVINGHKYLNRVVGHMDTSNYIPKLEYMPKKADTLKYNNKLCADLEGITPNILELTINSDCVGNLHSLRGIRKVGTLNMRGEIPAEWIESLIDDKEADIRILDIGYYGDNPELADAFVSALERYISKHLTTKIHAIPRFNSEYVRKKFKERLSDNLTTDESLTPCHTLMRTLNAVSEGWMDKVSGFLDKVDPE